MPSNPHYRSTVLLSSWATNNGSDVVLPQGNMIEQQQRTCRESSMKQELHEEAGSDSALVTLLRQRRKRVLLQQDSITRTSPLQTPASLLACCRTSLVGPHLDSSSSLVALLRKQQDRMMPAASTASPLPQSCAPWNSKNYGSDCSSFKSGAFFPPKKRSTFIGHSEENDQHQKKAKKIRMNRVKFACDPSGNIKCDTILLVCEKNTGEEICHEELWWTDQELKQIRRECSNIVQYSQVRHFDYVLALKLLYRTHPSSEVFSRIIETCSLVLQRADRLRGLERHFIGRQVRDVVTNHRVATLLIRQSPPRTRSNKRKACLERRDRAPCWTDQYQNLFTDGAFYYICCCVWNY